MNSLILRTAAVYMHPILLLFSLFLLLVGHNEPGGGFVGGLVASAGYVLYAIAYSPKEAREILRIDPHMLIGLGLLLAVGSATLSLCLGKPFMTGLWGEFYIPLLGKIHLGTPFFFDLGVYLDVIGVIVMIVYSMAEEE